MTAVPRAYLLRLHVLHDAIYFCDVEHLGARVGEALPAIMARACGRAVVVVTHGDVFNAYLPELVDGVGKFKADVAGWAAIAGPFGPRVLDDAAILEMHRVDTL